MTTSFISIELGDSHYYFISDVVAIRLGDYESMSADQKNNICTATTKFGEPVPECLITRFDKTPNQNYFYGRLKIFPSQNSPYKRSLTRIVPELEPFYRKIRHLCDLIDVNGKAYITINPSNIDNEDLQTFISYVQLTK
ncbi:MAG: hypothetical protein M0R77_02930 [Gammaproteobacteria bacterium]|nr:hypothetical protein [Gammaproteobacteria bacterium]